MDHSTDVVVVGGGIAGSALAKAASERGLRVTVLERQTAYRDKVRGEYMHPWGVAEARRLGVEDVLVGTGGTWITEGIGYDELLPPAAAEQHPLSVTDLRPDVPGAMDLGHPQACEALATAAAAAGSDGRPRRRRRGRHAGRLAGRALRARRRRARGALPPRRRRRRALLLRPPPAGPVA